MILFELFEALTVLSFIGITTSSFGRLFRSLGSDRNFEDFKVSCGIWCFTSSLEESVNFLGFTDCVFESFEFTGCAAVMFFGSVGCAVKFFGSGGCVVKFFGSVSCVVKFFGSVSCVVKFFGFTFCVVNFNSDDC